jgi:hypothetical protein
MAAKVESVPVSAYNTLDTNLADTITVGTAGVRMRGVEVTNPSPAAAILYFTYSRSATAPAAAVSLANDTYSVLPGSSTYRDFGGAIVDVFVVSIVGSGNTYSIEGVLA